MRCETCDGGRRPPADRPCPECGGGGITHCCDGDRQSAREAEIGAARLGRTEPGLLERIAARAAVASLAQTQAECDCPAGDLCCERGECVAERLDELDALELQLASVRAWMAMAQREGGDYERAARDVAARLSGVGL